MKAFSLAFSVSLLITFVRPSTSCYRSYVPHRNVKWHKQYNITDLPWLKRDWYFYKDERVSPKMRKYLPDCECGTNKYLAGHEKTVEGWNAATNEYPWSVWFTTGGANNGHPQRCGGSIIADRMILTSAHCVTNFANPAEPFKADEFLIYINSTNLGDSNLAKKAIAFYSNPRFLEGILATAETNTTSMRYDHNIAVIILENPIDFSDATGPKPICLPNIGAVDIKTNMKAEVIGYGLMEAKDKYSTSDILKKGSVSIIDVDECIKRMATDPQNGNKKVFAFDMSSVICTESKQNGNATHFSNSDYGGPLSVSSFENSKKIQIGIMSASDKSFDKVGDPIYFYTKVEANLPLIDYYAKKHDVRWCKPVL